MALYIFVLGLITRIRKKVERERDGVEAYKRTKTPAFMPFCLVLDELRENSERERERERESQID